MDDHDVITHVDELLAEEHDLEKRAAEHGGLSEDDRARLGELEVQLDQCWDLLRQRRARRHTGADPDDAAVRPGSTVEHYLQ